MAQSVQEDVCLPLIPRERRDDAQCSAIVLELLWEAVQVCICAVHGTRVKSTLSSASVRASDMAFCSEQHDSPELPCAWGWAGGNGVISQI